MGAASEMELISKFVSLKQRFRGRYSFRQIVSSKLKHDSVPDVYASIFNRTLLVYAEVRKLCPGNSSTWCDLKANTTHCSNTAPVYTAGLSSRIRFEFRELLDIKFTLFRAIAFAGENAFINFSLLKRPSAKI